MTLSTLYLYGNTILTLNNICPMSHKERHIFKKCFFYSIIFWKQQNSFVLLKITFLAGLTSKSAWYKLYVDTHADICFYFGVLCRQMLLLRFEHKKPKSSPHFVEEALTAMIMINIIIPQTSATTLRILAVLDASTALADSPTALAFCTCEKQVSKCIW